MIGQSHPIIFLVDDRSTSQTIPVEAKALEIITVHGGCLYLCFEVWLWLKKSTGLMGSRDWTFFFPFWKSWQSHHSKNDDPPVLMCFRTLLPVCQYTYSISFSLRIIQAQTFPSSEETTNWYASKLTQPDLPTKGSRRFRENLLVTSGKLGTYGNPVNFCYPLWTSV